MDTPETTGAAMHSDDAQARREAARMLGSAKTERKIAAARAVAESRKGSKWSEEQKAKLRTAQAERRARERLERAALGLNDPPAVKQSPGRPKKEETALEEAVAKRPRGRPRKSEAIEGTER